jgi:succinoglycan biosynthesis transport protein ExoP
MPTPLDSSPDGFRLRSPAASSSDRHANTNGALASQIPVDAPGLVPAAGHRALSAPLDGPALLKALQRRWLPALLIGLITAVGVSFAASELMPLPTHNVRSVLQISAVAPRVMFAVADHNPLDQFQRTQIAIVKSRQVIRAALDNPEVAALETVRGKPDPVLWVEKAIKADFLLGPEMLCITLSGNDPEPLIPIVNALTKAYMDVIDGKDHQKNRARLQELKGLHDAYSNKVHTRQDEQAALALRAGARDPQNLFLKQRMVLEEAIQAKRQLATIQSEIQRLTVRAQALGIEQAPMLPSAAVVSLCPPSAQPVFSALAIFVPSQQLFEAHSLYALEKEVKDLQVPSEVVDDMLTKDPEVQTQKKKVDAARKHLGLFEETVVNLKEDRRYQAAISALKAAELAYTTLCDQLRLRIVREVRTKMISDQMTSKAAAVGQGTTIKIELNTWRTLEKACLHDSERLAKESDNLNQYTLQLEKMGREITAQEETMRKFAAEVEALQVEQRAPSRIAQVEQAVVYPGDRSAKQIIMVAGLGAGSFGLVLFAFGWLEFRCRRITSPEDVVHTLGMRVMGTVPNFNQRPRRLIGSPKNDQARLNNTLTNSVDTIRMMLLRAAENQGLKVVLVTSAVGGEGKTTLASHLASSLARAGRKTLLMDADLRKPTLHLVFDRQLTPGFSEVLQGHCNIQQVTQATSCKSLSLIAAGHVNDPAIQALTQQGVAVIFQQLRQQYEFIIVDCSPILPVPDSLALSQHVDTAVFAVLKDVSRLPTVLAAYQRLSSLGLSILGTVVNGIREQAYPYYHAQPTSPRDGV